MMSLKKYTLIAKNISYHHAFNKLIKKIRYIKKNNYMLKTLKNQYIYLFMHYNNDMLSLSSYVTQNIHKIEHMNALINNVIICKVFDDIFERIIDTKLIVSQMKFELGSHNIINKYTKIMKRLNMNDIFYCDYEHTFFEILLLMRIIFDMYEHYYTPSEYILINNWNHWKYNDVHHIINNRSYVTFKDTLSIRLSNICLGNNIIFLQRIFSIDYAYIECFYLSKLANIKLKKYIYNYELHNNCPNIKHILCYGPWIISFNEFKFFMDKHNTLEVCEFLSKTLKQNNDVLKYVLCLPYVNVIDILRIFNIDMSKLLSFMIDNKLIDNDNLMTFINNNKTHNDYLLKLSKHTKYIDVNFISTYNNFKKVSREVKIIGINIFDNCVICADKFACYLNENDENKMMKITCCNKLMHKNCMDKLIHNAKKCQLQCPSCRTKIKLQLKHLLFSGRHVKIENKNIET